MLFKILFQKTKYLIKNEYFYTGFFFFFFKDQIKIKTIQNLLLKLGLANQIYDIFVYLPSIIKN